MQAGKCFNCSWDNSFCACSISFSTSKSLLYRIDCRGSNETPTNGFNAAMDVGEEFKALRSEQAFRLSQKGISRNARRTRFDRTDTGRFDERDLPLLNARWRNFIEPYSVDAR